MPPHPPAHHQPLHHNPNEMTSRCNCSPLCLHLFMKRRSAFSSPLPPVTHSICRVRRANTHPPTQHTPSNLEPQLLNQPLLFLENQHPLRPHRRLIPPTARASDYVFMHLVPPKRMLTQPRPLLITSSANSSQIVTYIIGRLSRDDRL